MEALWPWLAIAGAGALHGLNPASGWPLAAACGMHARDDRQSRRALAPIAIGQVAAMGALACAFSVGLSIDRALMRDLAVTLLAAASLWLGLRRARRPMRLRQSARDAGVALASFVAASAQGAGLMLLPDLLPLCAGRAPAGEAGGSGSLAWAVAAIGVHTAAMLLATGVVATGLCRVSLRRGYAAASTPATSRSSAA